MNTKTNRLIEKYELSGMGDRLADSWVGTGDDRRSLRELTDYFNRELLQTAMDGAGMSTLGAFSVLVDVRVVCEDCGTHADVRTLLTDGGCDCEPEP